MHSFQRLFTPYRGRVAALLSSLLLIAACGGGGSDGTTTTGSSTDTGTATATAFTQGTVTGFGSVIVNGVRFDDTNVAAYDDDGQKVVLGLGMRVEIDSGSIDTSAGTARAHAVRTGGLVTGPVQGPPDTTAGTLTVLGQGVDVTASTVFDDTLKNGLSAVVDGAVVEVHGLRDSATGRIVATRIQAKTAATVYALRGTVSALDATAKTFSIGGAAISYAAVTTVPTTLADGVSLRVLLATAAVDGVWQAQSFGIKSGTTTTTTTTAAQAHVRGVITAFTSAKAFSVDGIPVDASAATFPDGDTGLALGVQVDVKGTLTNGTIIATEVDLESRHRNADDRKFRLHGAISAVDTVAKTFLLRGITVSYAGTVTYSGGGTEAGLVDGAKVEVRGTVGATRNTLAATAIKFES